MSRYRVTVMKVDTAREDGKLVDRFTPAGKFETQALTPWDAIVQVAEEIKAEEAS